MQPLKPVYKVYAWLISRNLKSENIPKHIAIMMDANRPYSNIMGNKAIWSHESV